MVRYNYNLKSHKYVCITTYQPDNKSNPNPNHTTKQHAIVNIKLNIVTCPTYPDNFIRDICCCTVCVTLGCNCHTAALRPIRQVGYTTVKNRLYNKTIKT